MYPGQASPLDKKGKGKEYLPAGYHGITMVEEKLRLSEQRNTALREEISSLRKVQDQQGKALEAVSNQNDFPSKINSLLEDLRVQKQQNKLMKDKVIEAEKASRQSHESMVGLEQTIRELKRVQEE